MRESTATRRRDESLDLELKPISWFRSLGVMLRFDYCQVRQWALMMVIVQTMMGTGMALMYGFFYPYISTDVALYIVTGSPTLALIPVGFVMLPGTVAQQKTEGSFEYLWSLPVPRSVQITSVFMTYLILTAPGAMFALAVCVWRYDVSLSPSALLIPAIALSALCSVTVGYAMALAIRDPQVTIVVMNALIFFVLLFTPIVYPASHLPEWLRDLHGVLPFYNMASVIRDGLVSDINVDPAWSYVVLALWAVGGGTITFWLTGRRR